MPTTYAFSRVREERRSVSSYSLNRNQEQLGVFAVLTLVAVCSSFEPVTGEGGGRGRSLMTIIAFKQVSVVAFVLCSERTNRIFRSQGESLTITSYIFFHTFPM